LRVSTFGPVVHERILAASVGSKSSSRAEPTAPQIVTADAVAIGPIVRHVRINATVHEQTLAEFVNRVARANLAVSNLGI